MSSYVQVGNVQGVPARAGKNINGGDDNLTAFNPINLMTVGALRQRLNTFNATTFSTTRLNTMSFNDMVYAVRLIDYPSTI